MSAADAEPLLRPATLRHAGLRWGLHAGGQAVLVFLLYVFFNWFFGAGAPLKMVVFVLAAGVGYGGVAALVLFLELSAEGRPHWQTVLSTGALAWGGVLLAGFSLAYTIGSWKGGSPEAGLAEVAKGLAGASGKLGYILAWSGGHALLFASLVHARLRRVRIAAQVVLMFCLALAVEATQLVASGVPIEWLWTRDGLVYLNGRAAIPALVMPLGWYAADRLNARWSKE